MVVRIWKVLWVLMIVYSIGVVAFFIEVADGNAIIGFSVVFIAVPVIVLSHIHMFEEKIWYQ